MVTQSEAHVVTIWTIGHSTRAVPEFRELLTSAAITLVADVRRFPASRRYPHFNQQPLRDALSESGIGYLWLPELGGRRNPRPDSPNTAWRNASFRGYADYMATAAFREGLDRVVEAARTERVALLCSEAVWWRCHRSLIADALKANGYNVVHILSPTSYEAHPYTAPARIVDGKLVYTSEPHAPSLFD